MPMASIGLLLAVAPPVSASVPPCAASALRMRFETDGGRFTGMSHDGGIAVVRNVGATACTIPRVPTLELRDTSGAAVASSTSTGARFMHPGPFVPPLKIAPGAVAASQLRWIVGNVYGNDAARSVTSTTLALVVPGGTIAISLKATVWGRVSQPIAFSADRFATALPEVGSAAVSTGGTYVGEGPGGSTYLVGDVPARRLVVAPVTGRILHFTYSALGGGAGSISGTALIRDTSATYSNPAIDCKLAFAFYGPRLTVDETGSCGLGNRGNASGQYREL